MHWDTVDYDTDGFFSLAPGDQTVFTIPAGIDKVRLTAGLMWAPDITAGTRLLSIRRVYPTTKVVGGQLERANTSAVWQHQHTAGSAAINVIEGETDAVGGLQDAGGNLDVQTHTASFFAIEVVDPVASNPADLIATSGTFSQSLTVSGEPVVIGGGASTLQDAYDNGDGTITTTAEKPFDADHGAFSESLTVSGEPVSTGIAHYPHKGLLDFTTVSVAGAGGTQDIDQSGFNNRSLVRKLTVTPNGVDITAYQLAFYMTSAFAAEDLEYSATASGTYTDNDVWFHEDEDVGSGLHLRITNDSVNASTFTVELKAEVFA
jgi:hypothetical protein